MQLNRVWALGRTNFVRFYPNPGWRFGRFSWSWCRGWKKERK